MPANRTLSVLALLAIGLAGCGDKSPSPGAPATAKVNIASFKYAPDPIEVRAGGKVTWTNQDKAKHTAETEGGTNATYNTGDLRLGDSRTLTFDKPGTYEYLCVYHPFMKGTVKVVE